MKDELKGQLDALFVDAAKRAERAEVTRNLEAEAQVAFLEEFNTKKVMIFVPALEEFANHISPHGWTAHLMVRDEKPPKHDHHDRVSIPAQKPEVGLEFHRGAPTSKYGERSPYFSMSCDKAQRKVIFFESTIGPGHGGSSGGAGNANLDELTKDFIQEKLVKYFKKLVGDSRPYDQR